MKFTSIDATRAELRKSSGPRRRPAYDMVTRTLDLAVAGVALLIFSPAMLLIAVLVRRQDGGPALFRQKRLGLDGRTFAIIKFRSMSMGAETHGLGLRTSRSDPRVTRLGKHLREWHLDELPQLVNVLRGEMSLVGPRPTIPFHMDYYEPWEMARLSVRPGITGLAQVTGGNRMSWDDRIVIDVYFAHNRSLRMYCQILWATLVGLVRREGVYNADGDVSGWTRAVPDWYTNGGVGGSTDEQ